MARNTLRVERTCLVCEAIFVGTPAATRCSECKGAGRKVPANVRRTQRQVPRKPPPDAPLHDRLCFACASAFESHKVKAKRCEPCLIADNPIRSKECIGCAADFPASGQVSAFCVDCQTHGPPPEYYERLEAIEAEEREARRIRQRHERAQRQMDWLDERSRKPRGKKAMIIKTSKTTIGQLWVTLCMADGQINCLTRDSDVTVEDRERLLVAHFKLRLKGFTASAIAKVCPSALLTHSDEEVQAGLEALPQVEPDATSEHDHDLNGLSEDQRTNLNGFLAQQERQTLRNQLAL